MRAIISVISGLIGFVIIAGMQLNMLLQMKINSGNSQLSPTVYSIGMETKNDNNNSWYYRNRKFNIILKNK
jgi:hypothetical protein